MNQTDKEIAETDVYRKAPSVKDRIKAMIEQELLKSPPPTEMMAPKFSQVSHSQETIRKAGQALGSEGPMDSEIAEFAARLAKARETA